MRLIAGISFRVISIFHFLVLTFAKSEDGSRVHKLVIFKLNGINQDKNTILKDGGRTAAVYQSLPAKT